MIERLPGELPDPDFYITAELAALRRVSDPVHGMPRFEDTMPDNGFSGEQLEEIAHKTARIDEARAAAELAYAKARTLGNDCIR